MVKPIGGRIIASFHLGMSGLSARVAVRVQLTCWRGMAATGPGDITSSVLIPTQTLWYCGNLFGFRSNSYSFRIFFDLYVKFICFSPANFVNGLTWRSHRCGIKEYPQ
jgi:hypothetical protein